jgi:Na+-translocating ferredoxin:NAD+ oxidoreductase subunit C
VVFGGPLTGSAIYSEDHPILPDTNAIMVQDKDNIPFVSDYPCVNCGECVRICPARMQVNMLVRLLEAGHYEEAASSYDLIPALNVVFAVLSV